MYEKRINSLQKRQKLLQNKLTAIRFRIGDLKSIKSNNDLMPIEVILEEIVFTTEYEVNLDLLISYYQDREKEIIEDLIEIEAELQTITSP